jgi:translation initiation factor IF-1
VRARQQWRNRHHRYCLLAAGAVIAGRRRPSRPRTERRAPGPQGEPKEAALELFGTITQVFPSTTFGVELENGHTILAHIAGRLRRHRIKILPGDRVELEMSPYDLTKGRITYRYRAGEARRSS